MKENVWDYPRPPRLERSSRHLRVRFADHTIAETRSAYRVLETSHPPVYYFPPGNTAEEFLAAAPGSSFCEWKGAARYLDVEIGDHRAPRAAWSYPEPTRAFEELRDHVAFYPGSMDECSVDGEIVVAQPGDFYGGWITSDLEGPFKGGPGTRGW